MALSVGLRYFSGGFDHFPLPGRAFRHRRPHDLGRLPQDHRPVVSMGRTAGHGGGHLHDRTLDRGGLCAGRHEPTGSCPSPDRAGGLTFRHLRHDDARHRLSLVVSGPGFRGRRSVGGAMGMRQVFMALVKVRNIRIVLYCGASHLRHRSRSLELAPEDAGGQGVFPGVCRLCRVAFPLAGGIPALLILPRVIPAPGRGRAMAIIALLAAVRSGSFSPRPASSCSPAWFCTGRPPPPFFRC